MVRTQRYYYNGFLFKSQVLEKNSYRIYGIFLKAAIRRRFFLAFDASSMIGYKTDGERLFIRKEKSMRGKGLILGVALCLMLSGCAMGGDKDGGTGNENGTDTPNPSAAYELMISELQKELQELRAEQVKQNAAYEARIEELEKLLEGADLSVNEAPSSVRSFLYEEHDGQITITSYVGQETLVEIPKEIDGIPVTAIGEGAFRNSAVQAVVLPEGITTIGWFAFSGSYRLASVTLGASVTAIDYGAFDLCSSSLRFSCPTNSYAAQYAQSYGIPVRFTNQ